MDETTPLKSDETGSTLQSTASNHDDEEEQNRDGLLRRKSSRNRRQQSGGHHRRDSSLLEVAMESISDISDVIVERIEVVQQAVEEVQQELVEILEEPVAVPVKPREEGDHSQKLSAMAVAVLVFYKVSGGPFGCEPAVKAAGPFYALLGFTLFPILWCVPEALITAELGSAFPEPSGAVAWVEEAFGPTTSLLCGYFHWISGATDNAIYPSLFLKYLASYFADSTTTTITTTSDDVTRFLVTVGITLVLAGINYTGLELVGNLSIVVCIISMSPFVIMVFFSIPKLDTNRWWVLPDTTVVYGEDDDGVGLLPTPVLAGVFWRPLLNSLFWNLNSFDVGASFAGEIRDPQTVFPRAMFASIFLVVLGYLIPLLAALGAVDTNQSDWEAGYFTNVATEIAGPWLGAWTVFAAAISNIALFEAEMSGDAYQLMGMADRGLIPKLFTRRSKYGTPTNGILLGTFVIVAVSVADFDQLVEMLNFAYSLSLILEFAAFVKLRITDDDVERPYRIPLNAFGCFLFVVPPTTFLIYLMLIASKQTYVYLLLLIIMGVGFYLMQKFSKHYGWMEYVEAPKRERRVTAGLSTIHSLGSSCDSQASPAAV
ncbi:Probable polyamine transporter [Seminavis robusta]|uniref:Probable polyamine transporter n=1 Tax=Seminavis robusta TaxID=568900 RepID=A0A9N8HRR3_9STRA|nr:Probable polyamine transporter [Seminavis robusta]|eukprot:Sro1098_g240950.1 Probable polyamine transporter (600) ;mRNA; r:7668-9553